MFPFYKGSLKKRLGNKYNNTKGTGEKLTEKK